VASELSFEELLADCRVGDGLGQMARYAEILERWSQVHNLVRWHSRRELVDRHIADALAAGPLLTGDGRLLDVGSGAGLPGVPLLVAHPAWSGVLLEPRQKRWAFLRSVIRELGLDAVALRVRYQDYPEDGGTFDLVLARALGGHRQLLAWAKSRLTPTGQVLLWTTDDEAQRLAELQHWRVLSSALPSLDRGRLVQVCPCFT
jgi:16S rRNA (guanine527-N7)-methyltransferase